MAGQVSACLLQALRRRLRAFERRLKRMRALFGARNMARQENAERRAAGLAIGIDETASLLDDAIDGREPKPGALADFLGRKERLEDFVDNLGWNAGAGIAHLD